MRKTRGAETPAQTEKRRLSQRNRDRLSRENETPEQREQRRGRNRVACKRYYASTKEGGTKSAYDGVDYEDIPMFALGDMDVLCKHCGAAHYESEQTRTHGPKSFDNCCRHGKAAHLKDWPIYPDELRKRFVSDAQMDRCFQEELRIVNSQFAFASFCTNEHLFNPKDRAPPAMRVSGQAYRKINLKLYPDVLDGEVPTNGQLFMFDVDDAVAFRKEHLTVDASIIREIDVYMRKHNLLAKGYTMLWEQLDKESERAKSRKEEPRELKLLFSLKPGEADARSNEELPARNQVAAVFTINADGELPPAYIVVEDRKEKQLRVIKSFDPLATPMLYPLLFPNGDEGYSIQMTHIDTETRLSMREYISHLIQYRPKGKTGEGEHIWNPLAFAGKLQQAFLIDMYTRIEHERLDWLRKNQTLIHAALYQNLVDYVAKRAEMLQAKVGKTVILPSTYYGSPRSMNQHYQDAMAIVMEKGAPDLFVTMTCNPNDEDILKQIEKEAPGQKPWQCPIIVTRVAFRSSRP